MLLPDELGTRPATRSLCIPQLVRSRKIHSTNFILDRIGKRPDRHRGEEDAAHLPHFDTARCRKLVNVSLAKLWLAHRVSKQRTNQQ